MNKLKNSIVLKSHFLFKCLMIGISVIPGCQSSFRPKDYSENAPKDVENSNLVRQKMGIRPISKSWNFMYRAFFEEKWKDSKNHIVKVVERDENENILGETDYYYSGYSCQSLDPNGSRPDEEFLAVHYEHQLHRFFINYWGCDPFVKRLINSLGFGPKCLHRGNSTKDFPSGYLGETDQETLNIIDDILTRWKKTRLN